MEPRKILQWAADFRAGSKGRFQINLWIPDPPPVRDAAREARVRAFLAAWGPDVPEAAGSAVPPDFAAQCEAVLEAAPPIVSSVMGLYPPEIAARFKAKGMSWFAHVSTLAEARAAEAAGADVIVAQGMEAGGHRGCFDASRAEQHQVGLFSLLPAVVDTVRVPVIAAGGIADGRGVAAAFALGASAVLVGTGFLRCPEAGVAPAWAEALGHTAPEDTMLTRAFSGRAGRSIATAYARAAASTEAPPPAPYPVQRGLTEGMRRHAQTANDIDRMQAWAGQSAALARARPAAEAVADIWTGAQALWPGSQASSGWPDRSSTPSIPLPHT
jgi:nitronate monooxygenase